MKSDSDLLVSDDDAAYKDIGVRMRIQAGAVCSYDEFAISHSQPLFIGRDPSCGIVLSSQSVSRRHAKIMFENQGCYLYDLNSTNGVLLNGSVLTSPSLLQDHDQIYIGKSILLFANNSLYIRTEAVSMGGVVLRARGISRYSEGKLNDISLDIHKGELIAIIGGSGAGKTTLMNALSGMNPPHCGHVEYCGQDLYANYANIKSQIGYVPQKDIMHIRLKLKSMLKYAAQLRMTDVWDKRDYSARVSEVMNELGIAHAGNTMLSRVSGGQKKRASIAIEMLSDPDLFFLDEPTSGLDPGTERNLMHTLREFTKKGKTVILVTHSTLTLPLCDKVIIMGRDGNMTYFGHPNQACDFFKVKDYADIFDKIDASEDALLWRNTFESQHSELKAGAVTESPKTERSRRLPFISQTCTLIRRYLTLIANERPWLLTMLACVPILTFIVSVVSGDGVLTQYTDTYKTFFTLICVTVFVGLLTAYSEICKERDILYREYMATVRLDAYLISKLVVLLILNVAQSLLLSICFCVLVVRPISSLIFTPVVELWATLLITMYSTSCLGLLVSAVSPTRNTATSLLSIMLVPQIVFSGAVFDLEGMTRTFANGIHAFWGTNALAISSGMEQLDMPKTEIEKGLQAGIEFFADTPVHDYMFSSASNLLHTWAMLGLIGITCIMVSYVVLRLTVTKYKD